METRWPQNFETREATASDIIDVDERAEKALREKVNAQQGVERKPLTQEQGPGDYIAG